MGVGGSQPDKINARVSTFVNPKVTECVSYSTVSFQIYQENDGNVGFAPDPNMKQGQRINPFSNIYKTLDRGKEETVVITKISVEHILSQLDVRLNFIIKDIFDFKPSMDESEVSDDNNKEEMRVVFGGQQTLEENLVEEKGGVVSISIPPSFDDKIKKDNKILYRSTLAPSLIAKFAGQHNHLLDVKEGTESLLLEENHPLMLFILACKEPLKILDSEIPILISDRDQAIKMYQVCPRVIRASKCFLRSTIFAKMFYTTFKDTEIHVNVTKDDNEILKKKWHKCCGSNVAYKPTVSFVVKVKYVKVDQKKPRSKLYSEITNYV